MTSASHLPAADAPGHAAGGPAPELGLDLDLLRSTVSAGHTHDLAWRRAQLGALRRMLVDQEGAFAEAITADVGKPHLEVRLTETSATVAEIDHLLEHLREWTAPRRVPVPAVLQPATAEVHLKPKGVLLVIAPWNYPLQLLFAPLAGALAAGDTAVLTSRPIRRSRGWSRRSGRGPRRLARRAPGAGRAPGR